MTYTYSTPKGSFYKTQIAALNAASLPVNNSKSIDHKAIRGHRAALAAKLVSRAAGRGFYLETSADFYRASFDEAR